MESTLHQQLKTVYVDDADRQEVTVDGFRIDGIAEGRLIEIQCASLSGIRAKVETLLKRHQVRVVKPLPARKYLRTQTRKRGPVVSERYSPARATVFHLFDELVHFVGPFPHPGLSLEILLVEVEERRLKRKRSRRWGKDYRVLDRSLLGVQGERVLRAATDLLPLLPDELPEVFSTADLARTAHIPRWLAQKAAYCLRKCGAAVCIEQRGRLRLYRRVAMETMPIANTATALPPHAA